MFFQTQEWCRHTRCSKEKKSFNQHLFFFFCLIDKSKQGYPYLCQPYNFYCHSCNWTPLWVWFVEVFSCCRHLECPQVFKRHLQWCMTAQTLWKRQHIQQYLQEVNIMLFFLLVYLSVQNGRVHFRMKMKDLLF